MKRLAPRSQMAGFAMMVSLAFSGMPLSAGDLPDSPPVAARKQEIKLFITAENTPQAIQILHLDERRAVEQIACFFDTRDGKLQASHLILRARQKADAPGESTVKIRISDDTAELTAVELAIEPEQDWTHENKVTLSRSVSHSTLTPGLVAQAATGKVPVNMLFNAQQRALIAARLKDFNWDDLRAYGPVKVEIWSRQRQIQGFPGKVTVELWHLLKDGKKLDLLEVSAKSTVATDAQAQALAKQFYAAAKASGMGDPAGLTKTQMVMDFFKTELIAP